MRVIKVWSQVPALPHNKYNILDNIIDIALPHSSIYKVKIIMMPID